MASGPGGTGQQSMGIDVHNMQCFEVEEDKWKFTAHIMFEGSPNTQYRIRATVKEVDYDPNTVITLFDQVITMPASGEYEKTDIEVLCCDWEVVHLTACYGTVVITGYIKEYPDGDEFSDYESHLFDAD